MAGLLKRYLWKIRYRARHVQILLVVLRIHILRGYLFERRVISRWSGLICRWWRTPLFRLSLNIHLRIILLLNELALDYLHLSRGPFFLAFISGSRHGIDRWLVRRRVAATGLFLLRLDKVPILRGTWRSDFIFFTLVFRFFTLANLNWFFYLFFWILILKIWRLLIVWLFALCFQKSCSQLLRQLPLLCLLCHYTLGFS